MGVAAEHQADKTLPHVCPVEKRHSKSWGDAFLNAPEGFPLQACGDALYERLARGTEQGRAEFLREHVSVIAHVQKEGAQKRFFDLMMPKPKALFI